uniref:PRP39 pre-mRNA processing factor 39 n=1 Tax=Sphaerodactylus townsendi TaxID=933632 RepID=A0ACB8G739_9SAUR
MLCAGKQIPVAAARESVRAVCLPRCDNPKLYLNLLEMEYNGDLKQNEENILVCFDKAIGGPLPIKMRILFSQRKVEFLEDFGLDVNKLLAAYEEHQALLREQETLKRKAENGYEFACSSRGLLGCMTADCM